MCTSLHVGNDVILGICCEKMAEIDIVARVADHGNSNYKKSMILIGSLSMFNMKPYSSFTRLHLLVCLFLNDS